MTEEVKYDEVFTSRAILDLHGFFIITSKMDIIDNPKIIFNGLRSDELYLLDYIVKLFHFLMLKNVTKNYHY